MNEPNLSHFYGKGYDLASDLSSVPEWDRLSATQRANRVRQHHWGIAPRTGEGLYHESILPAIENRVDYDPDRPRARMMRSILIEVFWTGFDDKARGKPRRESYVVK